jgi:hypothetical protein
MIREIVERYPELKQSSWEETRAYVLNQQGESDAQVQAAMRKLDEQLSK